MRSLLWLLPAVLSAAIPVDTSGLQRSGPIQVNTTPQAVTIRWSDEQSQPWSAAFSLEPAQPLIDRIAQGDRAVLEGGRPQYWVETGKRRGGFDQFFDFPPSHPEGTRRFMAEFTPTRARLRSKGNRVEILIEGLRLGIFTGGIAYTFFPGSRLIHQEAVASTTEPDTAYYYDAGLQWNARADQGVGSTMSTQAAWYDAERRLQARTLPFFASERHPLETRYRTAAARVAGGSMAVFPSPHQYFMPRDFTSNLGHIWARSFRGEAALGIRQLPDENWRFYPWMNAPPGSEQRMGMFLQVSTGDPTSLLDEVARYTSKDQFPALPGHIRVATHFHLAYSVQAAVNGAEWVPPFKPTLRALGIDAAVIADFHGDGHPQAVDDTRLAELEAYYRYCRAQSGGDFLIVPGEEANVHFGGHWMLSFPTPVEWIMSRKGDEPFESQHPKYGKVYRVGNATEMSELIRRENGIAWTAHPRTKGSLGFPDKYRDSAFFRDPSFLGAGWKQMPADLSTLRLGVRSLNLLDDMAEWLPDKKLIPEVDVFQMDPTHEVYAHMNAAYVRLPALPRFDDYGQILAKLRAGDYFISTGEVLLWSVRRDPGAIVLHAKWTFPPALGVVVYSDGQRVVRDTVSLESLGAFGEQRLAFPVPASAKWARVEVWDVAGNGALTNPLR
jgi:hypothetical protein